MAAPGPKVASTHEAYADEVFASILRSSAFAKAPSLRQLLTFLWAHRDETIPESAIGTDALGRPPGFDPRVDATVRVVVARLRQRLREFYDGEGAACPLRLSIPLGGHQLVVEFSGWAPVEQPARAPRRPIPWNALIFGLSAAALGVSIGVMMPHPAQARPPLPAFWQTFLQSGKPTALYVPVLEPGEIRGAAPQWISQSYILGPDTFAAVKLAQFLETRGVHVQVSGTNALAPDSPLDGNLLLPGTSWSSPAVKALSAGANFQIRRESADIVRNRAPRPGELAEYRGRCVGAQRYLRYGVILQRTTATGARQLALAGVHTGALVSFLTGAENLGQLDRAWRQAGRPPDFEALVEAETEGDAALHSRLAAFRPGTRIHDAE